MLPILPLRLLDRLLHLIESKIGIDMIIDIYLDNSVSDIQRGIIKFLDI